MTPPRVLVVDNGSLSVAVLARRLRSLGALADVVACTEVPHRLNGRHQAIALSGTKVRAYHLEHYRPVVDLCLETKVPVLGVCGGMHIMAVAAGAALVQRQQRVGSHKVHLNPDHPVFAHVPSTVSLFQRHTLYLEHAPEDYIVVGWSPECPVEIIQSTDGRIIGAQAHLEFRQHGLDILRGFLETVS
jgi:GMP synthase (glutamine-hydrolysing)